MLILITILYNLLVIYTNKSIPESISASSYILKPYLFTIYCFVISILLLPIWLQESSNNTTFLAFIGCGGILFAGVTPFFFKDRLEGIIHYISGITSFICYTIWMIFSGNIIPLLIGLGITQILILVDRKNYIFYTEIISLITLIICLGMKFQQ